MAKWLRIVWLVSNFIVMTDVVYSQARKLKVTLTEPLVCPVGEYKLVFNDEFDGNALDTSKWYTFYPYGPKSRPDSCSFCRTHISPNVYREANLELKSGLLVIRADRENDSWFGKEYEFTSGMVNSRQEFRTYSKYEIRCKLPKGSQQWPAFWVFGWSTEFDIFEFICKGPRNPEFAIHKWLKSECPNQKKVRRGGPCFSSQSGHIDFGIDFSEEFHVFTLEYEPHMIKYFIDGIMVRYIPRFYDLKGRPINLCSIPPGKYLTEPAYPNYGEPVQVIASQSICRNHKEKNPVYPNYMEIDYIRVYQKEVQPDLLRE